MTDYRVKAKICRLQDVWLTVVADTPEEAQEKAMKFDYLSIDFSNIGIDEISHIEQIDEVPAELFERW